MNIVVDAMGADNSPLVEVEGAMAAIREFKEFKDMNVILVGKEAVLTPMIRARMKEKEKDLFSRLSVVNAEEIITMSDEPAKAFKAKPDASMVVAGRLMKEDKADAFVSAGNTGAVMVTALLSVGRIPGVIRPAICTPIPNPKGTTVLVDSGANMDCKPEYLAQFAIMGAVYSKHIMGVENPTIGLLSVGEEEGKGNELSLAAMEILKKLKLNFKGNVEGRDLTNGSVDVITCDGFVGNVALKVGEGVSEFLFGAIKDGIKKGGLFAFLGYFLLRPVFKNIKKKFSFDEYGGAPLLGIRKPVIITHGSANSKAIKNAIKVAANFIRHHINEEIEKEINAYEVKQ
ncbi:MAG: phosphate acyltransferase PlsX [bacterium]